MGVRKVCRGSILLGIRLPGPLNPLCWLLCHINSTKWLHSSEFQNPHLQVGDKNNSSSHLKRLLWGWPEFEYAKVFCETEVMGDMVEMVLRPILGGNTWASMTPSHEVIPDVQILIVEKVKDYYLNQLLSSIFSFLPECYIIQVCLNEFKSTIKILSGTKAWCYNLNGGISVLIGT